MDEPRYMPLISPKRTSKAMANALYSFQLHCSRKGVGCASEQEIREYIGEHFGPELAAKFKTAYLVLSPAGHR